MEQWNGIAFQWNKVILWLLHIISHILIEILYPMLSCHIHFYSQNQDFFFCFKRANVLAKSKMGIGGQYCFSLVFSARYLFKMQSATHSSCGQVTYHTVWQSVQSKKSYIWKKHGKRMHREEKSADLSMALNREKEKENYREYSMTFS